MTTMAWRSHAPDDRLASDAFNGYNGDGIYAERFIVIVTGWTLLFSPIIFLLPGLLRWNQRTP